MFIIDLLARLFPQFVLRAPRREQMPHDPVAEDLEKVPLDQLLFDADLIDLYNVCEQIDRGVQHRASSNDEYMLALSQRLASRTALVRDVIDRYVRLRKGAQAAPAAPQSDNSATAGSVPKRTLPHQQSQLQRFATQVAGGHELQLRPHIGKTAPAWPTLMLATENEHADIANWARHHAHKAVGEFLDGIKPERYPCSVPITPHLAGEIDEVLNAWSEFAAATWQSSQTTLIRPMAQS